MATATEISTTTTELGDSRVRLEVEVPSKVVEREIDEAALALGRDLKMPGFRQGKVPAPVVIQRVGRPAVVEEALRRALPHWYEQALGEAGVSTVGDPQLDVGEIPDRGAPLSFAIEIGVRPVAELGEIRGLEVPRPEPDATDEEVDQEVERLRDASASLENVDRPAGNGDFTVVDFVGRIGDEPFEGGESRGFLLELGSERFIPGFEEQLVGAAAGEERQVHVSFPEDYRAEHLAGQEAVFDVAVREVKEKLLPEVDEEFAAEAGGFDSVEELREDLAARVREAKEHDVEHHFRESVVDAAVAAARVEVPDELRHAKAHEMWTHTARRLQAQGIDPAQYLALTGKDEEELVHEAEPEADRALRREAVLAALVEQEAIEVSEDELLDTLRAVAAEGAEGEPSEKAVRRSLERAQAQGRDEALREDIAMRKAVDLLVESAKPVPVDLAAAREELWTPEKETAEGPAKIWTPGS